MSSSPLDPALAASLDVYCATAQNTGGGGDLVCRLRRLDPVRGAALVASGGVLGAVIAPDPIAGAILGGFAGIGAEILYAVYAPRPETLRGRIRESVRSGGIL